MKPTNWCCFLLVFLLAAQPVVAAEDKKVSREKEQVRKLQQAQTQLEGEKNKLQQEKMELETQAKALTEKFSTVEKDAAAATRRNAALNREQQATKSSLSEAQQKLEETLRREKDLSSRLATSDGENKKLQAALKASQGEGEVCEAKNVSLYLYGRELLARVEGQSALDRLLANEPLFGIKRVEIENTVQEYRDKFDSGKFQSKTAAK